MLFGTLGAMAAGLAVTQARAALPAGQIVTVEGVPIHYVRRGSGPPVVLIHGASGNLNDWTFRAAGEIARTHTVIAFDRPGHGHSGWPESDGTSIFAQARLLRTALTQIGIARALVVGHSYGGAVALAWAVEAPETVSGLMLLAAPSQVWPTGPSVQTRALTTPLLGRVLANLAPRILPETYLARAVDSVFAPQAMPNGYIAHLDPELFLDPASLRHNAGQLAALKPQVRAMVPRYPDLPMPVELLHGTADDTVWLDIHSVPSAAQIPRARLTRLDGVGHMPHHVALDSVLAALGRLTIV